MVCDIAFIETVAKIPLPDGRGISDCRQSVPLSF